MPALMLRRLAIAVAVLLGALVVAFGTLDTRPAWTIGHSLVPLVFAVTIALEWAVDHDTDEGILSIVFGKLESIWDSGGAGFYGAVAVGWLDLPGIEALGLGAACFGAYGLGRWAWPDEGRADTLETVIERLTDPGRSS